MWCRLHHYRRKGAIIFRWLNVEKVRPLCLASHPELTYLKDVRDRLERRSDSADYHDNHTRNLFESMKDESSQTLLYKEGLSLSVCARKA